MKQMNNKKLTLKKNTIAKLDSNELNNVKGGTGLPTDGMGIIVVYSYVTVPDPKITRG